MTKKDAAEKVTELPISVPKGTHLMSNDPPKLNDVWVNIFQKNVRRIVSYRGDNTAAIGLVHSHTIDLLKLHWSLLKEIEIEKIPPIVDKELQDLVVQLEPKNTCPECRHSEHSSLTCAYRPPLANGKQGRSCQCEWNCFSPTTPFVQTPEELAAIEKSRLDHEPWWSLSRESAYRYDKFVEHARPIVHEACRLHVVSPLNPFSVEAMVRVVSKIVGQKSPPKSKNSIPNLSLWFATIIVKLINPDKTLEDYDYSRGGLSELLADLERKLRVDPNSKQLSYTPPSKP